MNEPMQNEIMRQQEMVLSDEERQPCEVWTRVMGYHRPVASFNIGKKGEHYERRFFSEARVGVSESMCPLGGSEAKGIGLSR